MKAVQNFYKSTITQDWSIGTGIFYVSVKPTVSEGWLVVSPNNASLREVIYYNGTGTDGNGDYITVTQRGVGTTDEQTHTIGEPIRMNIDENYWDYLTDSIEAIVASGTPDADTSTAGKVEIATQTEMNNGTDIGSTNASLVPTPSLINNQIDSKITTAFSNGANYFIGTAGEAITAGNAVAVSPGSDNITIPISDSGITYAQNTYEAQTFIPVITGNIVSVTISEYYSGTDSYLTVSLFATSGGKPTGSALTSVSGNLFSGGNLTVTFSPQVLLEVGVTYAIVCQYTTLGETRLGRTANNYANGSRVYSTDGTNWTIDTGYDLSIINIIQKIGEQGKLYKTDTNFNGGTATSLSDNFVGFASENISSGNAGKIISGGIVTSLSGLTPATTYYLSDTPGAISTSAGTISRKIGKSLSSTSLLIKNDNI